MCGLSLTQFDGRVRVRQCPAWNRVALQSLGRSRPVNRVHEPSKFILYITFQRSGKNWIHYPEIHHGTKLRFLVFIATSGVFLLEEPSDLTVTIAFTERKEDLSG